ncbi:unnamed protein product [Parnassius apollo]|uniref:(apollo) hypothetical protein n=1 Tax=Parnassius apollo TaxID=110799 RepID=A0A8S3WEH4_PARAO|nr:unnamed protein product [Parnassius apollo]
MKIATTTTATTTTTSTTATTTAANDKEGSHSGTGNERNIDPVPPPPLPPYNSSSNSRAMRDKPKSILTKINPQNNPKEGLQQSPHPYHKPTYQPPLNKPEIGGCGDKDTTRSPYRNDYEFKSINGDIKLLNSTFSY